MKKMRKVLTGLLTLTLVFGATACQSKDNEGTKNEAFKDIKNVILLIGDGMGPNQIKAGEIFKGEKLFFQTLEQHTFVETSSASDVVTDSAAAATAYATGVRTNNTVIGNSPKNKKLKTIVDIAKEKGKRTGVITTENLNGATPMGFSAHSSSRSNDLELMTSAAKTSNVDLFASYTFNSMYFSKFIDAGYEEVENVDDLSETEAKKVIGAYQILASAESMSADPREVAFDRVVTEALEYLVKDEDGFFLMAEGAHIDHGGHNSDLGYMLDELYAFDDMAKAVVEWASKRTDTLVLLTADHETGGLTLEDGITAENMFEKKEEGGYKYFSWTANGGHTAADVYLYAYGPQVDFARYSSFETAERVKNIDVFKIMKDCIS